MEPRKFCIECGKPLLPEVLPELWTGNRRMASSSGGSQFICSQGVHMRSCSKRSVPYTGASEGYFRQVQAAVRTATRYSMGV
jgi:hypothetical protein